MRTRLICPFCGNTLVETEHPYNRAIEVICLDHMTTQHPIRWRISPKMRRAVKRSWSISRMVQL
jgi:hypothetical protein